jgi:ADP-ribose pyrophosphatase YjhB (NUDIX family)
MVMKLLHIVNIEGAIAKDNKYLIIQRGLKEEHAAGKMSLVGGKVEFESDENEIIEQTLKREIQEEVGVEVENEIRYVFSQGFVSDRNDTVVDIIFFCTYKSGEPTILNKDEVESISWMTCEEIIHHPSTPLYLKEQIERIEKLRKTLS